MKKNPRKNEANSPGLRRRSFVKLLPAGALAAYVERPVDAAQQQPPAQPSQKITKEMLHTAEALIGIELTDAQEQMALQGINQAVCVPCGFVDRLPRSIMFTGGLCDEAAPLEVALAFERATTWHTMRPKMDWT